MPTGAPLTPSPDDALPKRVRAHLCQIAGHATPITYQALAKALHLSPPNTINELTIALERLIEEDAASGSPLIAALVISKSQAGLPALGFFECAHRVGRFSNDPTAPNKATFHAEEYQTAVKFWRRQA